MGGQQSKPTVSQPVDVPSPKFDWGSPPDTPPEAEGDMLDLVFTSWANCKSKPTPAGLFKSDEEEAQRRESVKWRKRASFIELSCGEDSFFVSNTYKAIGIADGVGGWRDEGVDPTQFPNELMKYTKLYSETHRAELNPSALLSSAFNRVKAEKQVKAGGSTACVATLSTEEEHGRRKFFVNLANLGDSGAMLIRNNQMMYRIHEKVHGLHAPYQLSVLPKHLQGKAYSDSVADAVLGKVEVKEGDLLLLGTDGLFDNRFNSEIVATLGGVGDVESRPWKDFPIIGAVMDAFAGGDYKLEHQDPFRLVQREINSAYGASMRKEQQTPWSTMLRKFGVENAQGGKVDDITLVLARITTREEQRRTPTW